MRYAPTFTALRHGFLVISADLGVRATACRETALSVLPPGTAALVTERKRTSRGYFVMAIDAISIILPFPACIEKLSLSGLSADRAMSLEYWTLGDMRHTCRSLVAPQRAPVNLCS